MRIFDLDGPVNRYGTILFDLLMLNFFWIILSVFSFGLLIGPASIALYHSVHASVIHSTGSPMKTFFVKFKERFLVGFLGGLIAVLVIVSSVVSYLLMAEGNLPALLFPIYTALLLYLGMMMPYFIALASETPLKLKALIKYAFMFGVKHLPTSILIGAASFLAVSIIYMTALFGMMLVIAPLFAFISYMISDRIFVKYDLEKL